MLQTDTERILANLHVLGALTHNDKLMTNDGTFDIYAPTTLRCAVRMWYREGRSTNVVRIRTTVKDAIDTSHRILNDIRAYNAHNSSGNASSEEVDATTLRRDTMIRQFHRMIDGLKRSREGLENLMQTYRDDASMTSQIRLIDGEIGDFLEVMTRHSPLEAPSPLVDLDGASDDAGRTPRSSSRSPDDR